MTQPAPPTGSARRTYRYLRLAVVGLVAMLALAVIIAAVRRGSVLDSLSAYFYTPVRSVFVGALVGIGAALIVIKGRDGAENVMLNIAGMLAPVVAFVPTPRMPPHCDPVDLCDAAAARDAITNNMWAFLVIGGIGILAAGVGAWIDRASVPPTPAIAVTLWLAAIVWLAAAPGSLTTYGHYASALTLFALITTVAGINALHASDAETSRRGSARAYAGLYWTVAGVMLAAIVIAVLLWILQLTGSLSATGWLIYLEAVLIVAFAVFWFAQTIQFWRTDAPGERGPDSPPRDPRRSAHRRAHRLGMTSYRDDGDQTAGTPPL